MHTRSRIVSQVTRSAFSSVLLLQQIAALGPALANVPHNQVPSGPAPFHPNLTSSLLGNHAGWISGTPGHGDSGSGASNSPLLPASFGVGVASLPLARHSLPLVQHSNNVVQNIAGTKAVKQPVETVQLDMTASASTIVLAQGVIKHGSAVTIDVGGTNTTFHTGDKVTAAELVAIEQAQAGGQTLQLDGQGRASGGTFSLTSVTSNSGPISVASVIVPKNVTAIDQVSAKSSVNLSGDLTNYGSIDEVAKSNQAGSASLSALDIVNESTGLITSVGQGKGGVDLNLSAGKDFTNMGTITSSGALSIAADGTLSNTASGSGIIAVKDITLQSANIINGGTVASSSGNVNLTASASQNLNVNNAGGTISAVNGAINVRDAGYTGSSNTTIAGGNLLSQELNLSAGNGTTNVNVDQLTGTVSSAGNAVHVQAQTQDLILGPQHLSGDPTYYNDAVGGNIQITGDIVVTESLAIIANGSITATNGLTQITAINGAGTGQNITLVAGANITTGMGPTSSIATTPPVAGNATANVIFNGPSTGGGDINLTGASNTLSISSASTNGSSPGGSITLAAFSVSGVGGGHILLPSGSNIDASATAGNGNVAIIAGAQDGATAISINTVEHSGGAGGGTLQLYNVQPKSASGNPVTFDTTGAIQNGDSIVGDFTKAGNGSIQVGGALNASTSIDIAAGNIATLSSGATTNGPLAITAPGAITFGNNLTAPGGILIVSGGTVSASAAASLITSPASGAGGNIVVCAGAAFTETAANVAITGASNSGGNVDLTNVGTINTLGTGTNSQGGTVNLVAYFNSGGGVVFAGNTSITTGGTGTGNNGDVILNAGGTLGTALSSPASINVQGGALGTGNVTLNAAAPNSGITIDKATVTPSGSFTGPTINQNATVDITPLTTLDMQSGGVTLSGGSLTGGSVFPIAYNSATKTFTVAAYNVDVPNVQNPNITQLTITAFDNITCAADIQAQSISMAAENGNITISNSGFIKAPGGLTMVAAGSIFTTGAGPSLFISTASTTGNAGNITMVAGAAFTNGSTITVTGSSGGADLNLPNVTALNASSTAGKGGNITLVAFNSSVDVGSLVGASSVITTGGAAGFTNGNVTVVAGGSANAINTNGATAGININTTGGISGTGVITLSNSDPNATAANPVQIARANATITSGNFLGNGPNAGTIYLGNLSWDSNTAIVQGGSIVVANTISAVGKATLALNTNPALTGTSFITVQGSISANAVSMVCGSTITLDSSITAPGGITLVAQNSIMTQAAGVNISTSSAGNGGNITMVAGATFTSTLNSVTITGANSPGGGDIDFFSQPIGSLTTSSTVSGSGGKVVLVAFADPNNGLGGQVQMATAVPITTGGAGSGANGDVIVVGGNFSGQNAIGQNGVGLSVNATSGAFGSGSITFTNSIPNVATTNVVIDRLSGSITQGNFLGGALGNGEIWSGNLNVNGSTISMQSGSAIIMQGPVTGGNTSSLIVAAGSDITIGQAVSVGSACFTAGNSGIQPEANIVAPGGITMVTGGDIDSFSTAASINTNSQTGNAGNITLVAGATFTIAGGVITVTGANSVSGGDISFLSPFNGLSAQSTLLTGSGGNITLVAFGRHDGFQGLIDVNPATTIVSGGGARGDNGNVIIVSGNNAGQSAIGHSGAININTTGGASGTGNITLSVSAPATSPTVSINQANAAVNGTFLGGPLTSGTFTLGQWTTSGALVTLGSAGGLTINSPIASGSQLVVDSAGTIAVNAALNNSSITLNAMGTGGIQVNSPLTTTTGVTLSSAAGQSITAVNITSPGGNIIVNSGAGVTLGTLDVTNGATGGAGFVSVTTASSTPLTIGSTGANNVSLINIGGGTTSGNAGAVTLQNTGTGGITLQAGGLTTSVVSGNGAIIFINSGTAGAITLPTNTVTANGAGSAGTAGNITLTGTTVTNLAMTNLVLSANGSSTGTGAGGIIQVTLTNSTPVVIGSAVGAISMSATAGALGGVGGSATLTASNAPLTVDGTAINVNAAGSNGTGGTISLTGTSITAANGATQPLILSANGTGSGSGGTIILAALTSALTIGTAAGNVELLASSGGGGGGGGIISVTAGSNLTVNPLGIIAGPAGANGDGAQLTLTAGGNGTGNLIISSTLSANGAGTGGGGLIALTSNNSTTPFSIGSAKFNGVVGLSVRGTTNGAIFVTNNGGSITQTVALTAVDVAAYTAGGPAGSVTVSGALGDPSTSYISLSAAGTGNVTGTGLLTASQVFLNSNSTGTIGAKTTAMKLAAGAVTVTGGGLVNLSDSSGATLDGFSTSSSFAFSSAGNINVESVNAATTVSIITTATNGSIIIGGQIGSGTTTLATLTAKGTGSITNVVDTTNPIEATTVNLTTTSGPLGSGANPLEVEASSLSALTTGNVNITNIGTGPLTLTGGKSTNAFTISSAGDINTGKVALTSASVINFITTANNGNIAVGASQGGTKTLGISLQADGSGNITEVKGVKLTSGATVGMVSATGSIGTSALPMVEVAPSISFNTSGTGAVFATNSYTKATTLQNSSAGAGFTLTSGSGGLTVNDISAGSLTNAVGSITLTATGGAIKTVAGTTQSNANGGITFNNTSTKGTIEFGANSNVTSFENTGGGTIEVVVGKLPPPQANNTPPSGVTAGGTTPLMIFFNNGLTAVGSNNANSENALLIFSAPSATLIKLDGGVTITADPLAPAPISPVSSQLAPAAAHTGPDRIVLPAIMAGQNEDGSSPSSNTTSPSVLTISGAENATTQNLAPMNGTLGSNSGVPYLTASSALSSSLLYSQDGTRTYFTGAPARAGWISDTELETGKIPAIIFGDVANALDDSVKSYADIETTDEGVVQNTIGATTTTAATKQSMATPSESALVGGISRTVRLIHTEKNSCRRSNLKKGSVLIASSTDSVINTPLGKVSIAARSLALVMSFSGGVAVFNLDDSHRDAVSISVGGNKIALAPGKSVVIASDATKSFDRINPAQLICYQGVTEHHLGNGMKVFKADFSLPSAINAVAPLKSLLQSNHPEAKRICGHLLKTTSIVMQLQGGFSNFYQIRRPQLTAYIR